MKCVFALILLTGILFFSGCFPEVPERFTRVGSVSFGEGGTDREISLVEDRDHRLFMVLKSSPLSRTVWQIAVILRNFPDGSDILSEAKKFAFDRFSLEFGREERIDLPGTRIEILPALEYGPKAMQLIFTDREYEKLCQQEDAMPETRSKKLAEQTKNEILILEKAVMEFYDETGVYPALLNDLLVSPGIKGWNGPYLNEKTLPLDPWKRQYVYRRKGTGFELFSTGASGTEQLR